MGEHIGCIGAVHAVYLDAAGRHKPEDLVSIEGTAALGEAISNTCEPSVEDQHLGGVDLIGFALALLVGEVFGRASGSDGGLSFDERDCSQLLLIEVEELLYIDLAVRQVAVEVGERLVAFTQGDAYEGSFIEGELAVLDAALDHLLGDTDTSLFLGAEQLTDLSFCLGAYDDGEPAGLGGLLRRGEDLYIISILELMP